MQEFSQSTTPLFTLFSLGLIGSIDEFAFHRFKHNLHEHKECLKENVLHTLRLYTYVLLFWVTPNFKLSGIYALLMLIILYFDALVGILDVLVEPSSRKKFGGLSGGEYLLHMLLSFTLGMFYLSYMPILMEANKLENNMELYSTEFLFLKVALAGMGLVSLILALISSVKCARDFKKD